MDTVSILDKYPIGGFRLVKSAVLPLTKELAREHQALDASPTERDLQPRRIKHLRQKAELGHLVTFHWAKAKIADQWVRMNGQHSATMLAQLNGEFPEGLFVTLDEYEVDSTDGLALLFRQFDDRVSSRSTADVAGAYQGLYEPLRAIDKSVAKLGIDAIAWHLPAIEGIPVPSGDEKYRLFVRAAYHPFLLWLGELFTIKTPELRHYAIAAAMYGTFITGNNEDVRRFWDQVARGGLEYEDNAPSTVLDNWLKEAKERGTKRNLKPKLKPIEYYQGCIYGWNAFREEKTLKDIKYDTRKGLYTPHD